VTVPALRKPAGPDDGTTLIEVMMAVAVLGIAFATLVGGMFAFTYGAESNSRQASGAAYIREYAEAVAGATYQPCANRYATTGFNLPAGWSASAMVVSYWNASTFVGVCPTPDLGLQRVHLTLSSIDGRDQESVDIVKRTP
jgi:type II secretory pathway pseudopilin PulG